MKNGRALRPAQRGVLSKNLVGVARAEAYISFIRVAAAIAIAAVVTGAIIAIARTIRIRLGVDRGFIIIAWPIAVTVRPPRNRRASKRASRKAEGQSRADAKAATIAPVN